MRVLSKRCHSRMPHLPFIVVHLSVCLSVGLFVYLQSAEKKYHANSVSYSIGAHTVARSFWFCASELKWCFMGSFIKAKREVSVELSATFVLLLGHLVMLCLLFHVYCMNTAYISFHTSVLRYHVLLQVCDCSGQPLRHFRLQKEIKNILEESRAPSPVS